MGDRLLIVDDENGIRALLGINLSKMGYTWDEAGDACQALKKIEQHRYSLVLLDISMPGMTGRELLPLIKEKSPDTAVIMATALADTSLAIKCMKEGAYDYLTKPFDFNNLDSSISRALEKRRLELENREYKEHLEEKVEEQADKIRQSFFNAMTSLAYALEARDEYTSGHSNRVTVSALVISEQLGVDPAQTETIRLASMVHDIGKIGIKENVLNKPGKLTEDEFRHIKTHPEIGEHILQPVVDNQEIISIVRHHHERYDGNGYPDGLKEEEIPLGARVLAVADSYDAMTSQRPYRAALSQREALNELVKGKGTQFDPQMVDIFISFCCDRQEDNNKKPG
ncbi:MAG: response regulator [Dehalococcoidaceae bacterium]|nr:response regulator [Dehalococcoidaceae bacterium]